MLRWDYISEAYEKKIDLFSCSDESQVENYLKDNALIDQSLNLTKTRLYFDDEDNLVGYFTLYNDMMAIGREKRRKHGLTELPQYKYYPAIKLHYLGIDEKLRKRGYGKYLLISALAVAKKISEETGCLFLSLESLDSSIDFYLRHEFIYLAPSGGYHNMFFKLSELGD